MVRLRINSQHLALKEIYHLGDTIVNWAAIFSFFCRLRYKQRFAAVGKMDPSGMYAL